jgi:two-component system, OmpR family, alkaline phosphatase synthesis response regulator PhoP
VASRRTILVVEDEHDTRALLRRQLEREGYAVREAETAAEAFARIVADPPALVVLDLMLPDADGRSLCRRLRASEATRALPIIMVTGRTEEVDRVLGLELGADDYVTKPFSARELGARVRAVLRRARPEDTHTPHDGFQRGRLRIDFETYEVFLDGEPAPLSRREFELLRFFVQHPNRVYDRHQLIERVWGSNGDIDPRTVDAHIRRLRMHIERDDALPEAIVTVRGVGYRFTPSGLESRRLPDR